MPTTRRFAWTYKPTRMEDAYRLCAQARGVVGTFCEGWPQWYGEPKILGGSLGVVRVEVTITSRDQWWVDKRARNLLEAFRRHTDIPALELTEDKNKLPPHEHRGKTYLKEKARGRSD